MDVRLKELLNRMVGVPRDNTSASEKHEVVLYVDRLQAQFDDLVTVAHECGTNAENPDTCGVCKLHFAECEQDLFVKVDEHDVPTCSRLVCPGARVRESMQAFEIENECARRRR